MDTPRRPKVFCIGRNKTGTTSLEAALISLGFKVGVQADGELLMEDWANYNFRRIIDHCKTADAFQDIPFSLDFTYQVLDHAFPGSKFILTVRNSPDEWYESLVRHHTNLIGKGRMPTPQDLKWCRYRKLGWLWKEEMLVYGVDESNLYDRDLYIRHYENHQQCVLEFFQYRPQDLLLLNLSEADSMQTLCDFVGVPFNGRPMPHLNSSRDTLSLHTSRETS